MIFRKANMPVAVAAKALGVDTPTVRVLCQQSLADWGTAYRRPVSSNYSYLISPLKFYQETGFLWEGVND